MCVRMCSGGKITFIEMFLPFAQDLFLYILLVINVQGIANSFFISYRARVKLMIYQFSMF